MITAHDHDHGAAMGPMGRRPCGDVEAAGCEIPKKWILVTWINQSMVMIH